MFYKSMPDFPMDSNNGNCGGASIGKYIIIKLYNKLWTFKSFKYLIK